MRNDWSESFEESKWIESSISSVESGLFVYSEGVDMFILKTVPVITDLDES